MGNELTLRQKQVIFTNSVAALINFASKRGLELTMGDGNIDPTRRVRVYSLNENVVSGRDLNHLENGSHYKRLAQDFNLFVDGVWKTSDCPEWQILGLFWKSLHPLARWGGDFSSVDLNHFSFEDEGVA